MTKIQRKVKSDLAGVMARPSWFYFKTPPLGARTMARKFSPSAPYVDGALGKTFPAIVLEPNDGVVISRSGKDVPHRHTVDVDGKIRFCKARPLPTVPVNPDLSNLRVRRTKNLSKL